MIIEDVGSFSRAGRPVHFLYSLESNPDSKNLDSSDWIHISIDETMGVYWKYGDMPSWIGWRSNPSLPVEKAHEILDESFRFAYQMYVNRVKPHPVDIY